MSTEQAGAPDPSAAPHLDHRAFDALAMREVDDATIDSAIAAAGDALVCVFFWGVDCFNCEMAKKAMLANPGPLRALELHWLHANVYAHPQLGRRFGLHGIPVFMFFQNGKKLGRATGWHGRGQFAAAVANARLKASGKPLAG
ncbi:thioredoxin family protein [Cupriavidus taiwanensis]|uniref:Putative THIOREDOXIN PROTEIN n=1 Tax=Cupriavidus taiwanensis TaxID=164546 RepID=A0A7Z7J6U7_9BURK|nr:thioredoxin family protein [Cupriavidus taiwanensis]SOY85964.1 putative THIOREDOXIN PROTEIN [Cupriavidus taiwanensis]SOZ02048.1 putative THIOREDOXIN PROTEIN [Cupriavidus taiwanensis]SOZ05036.1 putative THIOREDOXIN PROTEIN [Cupriavidus taiwanensis]SPC09518.1 putative THIOREDOXIN PROTEIN [Cupriavidus taiwanensis]SPD39307.1 putative THIOREDOXIN PROTEIN [Cupriavidus taiwanensis]